jgi:hypothetical protein
MRQHKVGEAFAIGSEHTRTNLVRAGMEYQPAVHDGYLFHFALEDAFCCFTSHYLAIHSLGDE